MVSQFYAIWTGMDGQLLKYYADPHMYAHPLTCQMHTPIHTIYKVEQRLAQMMDTVNWWVLVATVHKSYIALDFKAHPDRWPQPTTAIFCHINQAYSEPQICPSLERRHMSKARAKCANGIKHIAYSPV